MDLHMKKTGITQSLLADISYREQGVTPSSRIEALSKTFKGLGMALIMPLALLPSLQAEQGYEINTAEEARAAGKRMAENLFRGAYEDHLKSQKVKAEKSKSEISQTETEQIKTPVPSVSPVSSADVALARCVYTQAIARDPLMQEKALRKYGPALDASITEYSKLQKLNPELKFKDAERAFLNIYEKNTMEHGSEPAFNQVVMQRAQELNLPITLETNHEGPSM